MNTFNIYREYRKALNYTKEKHKGVFREGNGKPYLIHPINVVKILKKAGYDKFKGNETLFVSALLHDVIEDTETKIGEIEEIFGEEVAKIVTELTNSDWEKKVEYLENFANVSKEARLVKLADRIDNLSDFLINSKFFEESRVNRFKEQSKIILKTCGKFNKKMYLYLCYLVYKFEENQK